MSSLRGDAAEYHSRGALAEEGFYTNVTTDYLPHDIGIDPRNGLIIYTQARRASRSKKHPGRLRAVCTNHERIGKGKRIHRGYRPGVVDFFLIWIPGTLDFYVLPGEAFNGRTQLLPEQEYSENERYTDLLQYKNAWHLIREHPKFLDRRFISNEYWRTLQVEESPLLPSSAELTDSQRVP